MVCGLPSSSTVKSSDFRSLIGLFLSSVATTSTTTSRVVARRTDEDLFGVWSPGTACAMTVGRKKNDRRNDAEPVRSIPSTLLSCRSKSYQDRTDLASQKAASQPAATSQDRIVLHLTWQASMFNSLSISVDCCLYKERMFQPITSRREETFLFAKNFLQHPKMLGSLIPSSRFLVDRLLGKIDWGRAKVIVEYGP